MNRSGLMELHIAVLLFGGTALFSRLIPMSAWDITVIRCAISAAILALLITSTKQRLTLNSWQDYRWAMILGIIVSLHWVTYFAAMQLSSVAIGMIAFFTYPVMTVLIEPWFSGSKLHWHDVLSGILVLTGVVLLIPEVSLANDVTLGILVGVLSAALFTARNLLQKRYFAHHSGAKSMCYQSAVAAIFLLPFSNIAPTAISQTNWLLLLLLGIGFTAAPHALFNAALRKLPAKTVGLVGCLQPLYGTLLAWILLHEQVDINTLIGGILVVCTALFETARSHRLAKTTEDHQ